MVRLELRPQLCEWTLPALNRMGRLRRLLRRRFLGADALAYPRYGYGAGYRAGYRHGYHNGGHDGGFDGGKRPSHHGNTRPDSNIYGRPSNSDRVAKTQDRNTRQQSKVANSRANNVYTDRSGNVYRRNDNGSWDKRDKSGWTKNNGVPSAGD